MPVSVLSVSLLSWFKFVINLFLVYWLVLVSRKCTLQSATGTPLLHSSSEIHWINTCISCPVRSANKIYRYLSQRARDSVSISDKFSSFLWHGVYVVLQINSLAILFIFLCESNSSCGYTLLFLPPYCTMMNPIEEVFSKILCKKCFDWCFKPLLL